MKISTIVVTSVAAALISGAGSIHADERRFGYDLNECLSKPGATVAGCAGYAASRYDITRLLVERVLGDSTESDIHADIVEWCAPKPSGGSTCAAYNCHEDSEAGMSVCDLVAGTEHEHAPGD